LNPPRSKQNVDTLRPSASKWIVVVVVVDGGRQRSRLMCIDEIPLSGRNPAQTTGLHRWRNLCRAGWQRSGGQPCGDAVPESDAAQRQWRERVSAYCFPYRNTAVIPQDR
jgi:hypothetical protein